MEQRTLYSSRLTNTYTYDVFLSFRGEDTRTGFTGNLYRALSERGVLTFMDDDGLGKGEEVTPSLLNAIQQSRMAIIVFSKNYASSTFCLNELVQILECYTKEKGRCIWPIFYDVDPSEVRRQTGSYGEALAELEQGRFKDDIEQVQKWRLALRQAADLAGWPFKHGGEYEHVFIRNIIEEVSCKLNRPSLQHKTPRLRLFAVGFIFLFAIGGLAGILFLQIANYHVGLRQNTHNLSYSYFPWDKPLEEAKVLSLLIFTDCENTRQTHDTSGFPNLAELCVDKCTNLTKIYNSIGFLEKLLRCSTKGCTNPRMARSGINFTSLEYLCLWHCSNHVNFPEILGPMLKLKFVALEGRLENKALTTNILWMLPTFIPFLKTLRLPDSNVTILIACIEQCRFLELLDLCNCKQLQEIRCLPQSTDDFLAYNSRAIGFATRKFFVLPQQRIPEWFGHISKGNSPYFWFRKEFPSIAIIPPYSGWSGTIKWTRLYVNQTFTWMEDVRFIDPYANLPMSWSENIQAQRLLKHFAFPSVMLPYWEQALDNNVYNNLVLGESSQPLQDIGMNNEDDASPKAARISDGSNDKDEAFVDRQANFPGQLSQAPEFVEAQNIQVQSLTSSSGQVRRELHLGTGSITVLPTPVDASLGNQTEVTQDDDLEMEEFYAPLDAETHVVSCSYDKLPTPALSEEAKEALKILQDFISNDASVLLDLERCSVVKTILENLSNLSADDDISTEMRTLISEAAREFTHWCRDYNEASMKIESAASELQRANELEVSLESNKNQFREVGVLEKQLLQKLARMEKIKNDLEEQIKVIESNISASQSEKKTTLKRKREIFEEGKRLKIQRDELREKAPNLQHQHGFAKETQKRIQAEWSKLREKFKKIVIE